MIIDIVERLRENVERVEWTLRDPEWRPTREYVEKMLAAYHESVDEIERLTKLWNDYRIAHESVARDNERLEAEIEQLRSTTELSPTHVDGLRDEIERLRALKTPASSQLLNITKGCLDNAEAEIERVRAASEEKGALIFRLHKEIERLQADYDLLKGDYNSLREDNRLLREGGTNASKDPTTGYKSKP